MRWERMQSLVEDAGPAFFLAGSNQEHFSWREAIIDMAYWQWLVPCGPTCRTAWTEAMAFLAT